MIWRWLIVPIPLGLALLIAFFLARNQELNPILYMRADLGTLIVFAGLSLSFLAGAGLMIWAISERMRRQAVDFAHAKAAADRRQFLRRLDHELKNPLTAIRAGLANLADKPSAGTWQTAMASVVAETIRISRLTADLRKLAEMEARPLEESTINMADLLEEAITLAKEQPQAFGRKMRLTLPQAPWPLPTVQGDRDLLFLAFYNLVENALKFSREGDTIEVRAVEDEDTMLVEVADTGPGIPEGELPFVWDELYRGHGANRAPGSGLGLALVRAIAERHRGSVDLRSRVGQGTVVSVRLPLM